MPSKATVYLLSVLLHSGGWVSGGMAHGFMSTIGLIKRARLYFEEIAQEIRKMAESEDYAIER